jgi:hypothetical protein
MSLLKHMPRSPTAAKLEFSTVLAAESACIGLQRINRGLTPDQYQGHPERRLGLALSGGGVRSASFAVGVIQALHNTDSMKWVDYLSTVSGGGYAGSSITWFHYLNRLDGTISPFPFGEPGYSVRAGAQQTPTTTGGEQLSFVRQHSSYLTPSSQLDFFALVGVVLRNAFVSASVYLSLTVLIAMGLMVAGDKFHGWIQQEVWLGSISHRVDEAWWPAILLLVLFAALSVLYGVLTFVYPKLSPTESTLYKLRVISQRIFGVVLKLVAFAAVIGSLPVLVAWAGTWNMSGLLKQLVGTTGLVGTLGSIVQFYKQLRPGLSTRAWVDTLRIAITGSCLVYAVLLSGWVIAAHLYADQAHLTLWFAVLSGFVIITGFLINLNFFGIGRMYRDRIMETFMADPKAVTSGGWGYANGADTTFLTQVSGPKDLGPYHLINCNVVLRDTLESRFRNRGGDSFIMSHAYCGGDAVGWIPTMNFGDGTMSLATATAASGAAVNPYAAVAGKGATRTPLVSFMLAFFGVRLGYWVPNPSRASPNPVTRWFLWPNLLLPGIRQGILGSGFNTDARFLELTDGGHFDNTGLYELVRRACSTVILSLASADPTQSMADLANAIERIRVDFGVYIYFEDMLDGLHPCEANSLTSALERSLLISKTGYAVGIIEYPNKQLGKLIVLKSSIIKHLPIDTIVYASQNGSYPNESTANQFFTEEQFEAYRESGYHIAKRMLADQGSALWTEDGKDVVLENDG